MVVTRRAPAPITPVSRTNSDQSTPRTTRPKAPPPTLADFTSPLAADDPPSGGKKAKSADDLDSSPKKGKGKGKGKQKYRNKKSKSSTSGFIDLLGRALLLWFTIYTLSVCPNDESLQSPVCRGLYHYRRLVLEPYVFPPLQAAFAHPAVAPYIARATPHVNFVITKATPVVQRTHLEWNRRVVPQWKKRIVPQWKKRVVPAWNRNVVPHLREAERALAPYRARVEKEYATRVAPHARVAAVQLQKWQRQATPYVVLAAHRVHDGYRTARPYAAPLWARTKVVVRQALVELAKLRRTFVDPHVARIWDKVLELGGRPRAEGTFRTQVKKAAQESKTPKKAHVADKAVERPVEVLPEVVEIASAVPPASSSNVVERASAVASSLASSASSAAAQASAAPRVVAEASSRISQAGVSAASAASSGASSASTAAASAVGAGAASVHSVQDKAAEVTSSAAEAAHEAASSVSIKASSVASSVSSVASETVSISSHSVKDKIESATAVAADAAKETASSASFTASTVGSAASAAISAAVEEAAASASSVASKVSAAAASATASDDEDLSDFYADLGISDDLTPLEEAAEEEQGTTPAAAPVHVETDEEKAERLRMLAEKRAKILARHAHWEVELDTVIKSERKALRKALVVVRKAGAAELAASDAVRAEVEGLVHEAEKFLKGADGYLKNLKKETRKDEEKATLWDRVLDKIDAKFAARIGDVEGVVNAWYAGYELRELEEVQDRSRVVREKADAAQADIGMEYVWLEDVTYDDWQRYHDLLRLSENFTETALMIQNGTHASPPANPVLSALADLESEVQDVVVGFETRLRRIKRAGDRAFRGEGEDLPEDAADEDEVPEPTLSILPHPGETHDPGLKAVPPVVLGRGKEEVLEALERAGTEGIAPPAGDAAKGPEEEVDGLAREAETEANIPHVEL